MSNNSNNFLQGQLVKNVLDPSGNLLPPRTQFQVLAGNSSIGVTTTDDPATGTTVISLTGTGSGASFGQYNVTLANGLNSNIATSGLSTLRIGGPSAAFSVGGFTPPAAGAYPYLLVTNTTSQPLTFVNSDAGSTATWRITTQTGANVVLQPKQGAALLLYDQSLAGWVLQNIGVHQPTHVLVDDYGADKTGAADSTAAFTAAHAALPASGGEIRLLDGATYKISNVVFTKPVRLRFGRTVLTQVVASSGAMFSTNANLTIEGHSQNDSLIEPATGCTGVALSGAFSLTDYGTPSFICERVGFVGGAYGIDTNGLTSPTFGGGIFVVEHCRFTTQSQIGLRVKDGTFFTFVRKVIADTCGAAGVWIGNNTETKLSECTLINSATGPGLVLAGVHHVTVSESEFYGTAGSSEPDILLYGTSGGQGICDIVRNKFGSERTYVPVSARRNIVIDSPDSPAVETDIYRIEQNRFYATRGVLLASISRTSNVGNATVDIAALGVSDMGLQTGDQVWIAGSAGGDHLAALSGGPFTITRTSASTFTWTSTGSDLTAELGAGFVFLANSAAITHATPIGRATYDGNYFDGYGACVDDTADITEQIRDTSGRCVWTDTNTMVGPLGLACQEFLSGGRQFSVVRPTANSPQLSFGADARVNETPGIRNRIAQDSENLSHWGALNGSVTTGQTDPFGTTRACKLTRTGTSQVITNSVTPTMGEGFSSGNLDTTGSPTFGFVSFWAMQGPSGCGSMLVWLQTTDTFPMFENVSLGMAWKRYRLPFRWPPGGDGAMSLRACPGGEDAMPCDALVFGFQVDDYGGDYLPAVNGSASVSAAGNRWERAVVAAGGIKGLATTSLGGGSAPTVGTIGGSGPASAVQSCWIEMYDASGTAFWLPAWR